MKREDLFVTTKLGAEVKSYNEALHLTPKEKETMWSLYHKIESEYYNNTVNSANQYSYRIWILY